VLLIAGLITTKTKYYFVSIYHPTMAQPSTGHKSYTGQPHQILT